MLTFCDVQALHTYCTKVTNNDNHTHAGQTWQVTKYIIYTTSTSPLQPSVALRARGINPVPQSPLSSAPDFWCTTKSLHSSQTGNATLINATDGVCSISTCTPHHSARCRPLPHSTRMPTFKILFYHSTCLLSTRRRTAHVRTVPSYIQAV